MLLKAVLSWRQLSDAFIYAVRLHFSCLIEVAFHYQPEIAPTLYRIIRTNMTVGSW